MHYTLKRSKIPNPRNSQYSECPPLNPYVTPNILSKL